MADELNLDEIRKSIRGTSESREVVELVLVLTEEIAALRARLRTEGPEHLKMKAKQLAAELGQEMQINSTLRARLAMVRAPGDGVWYWQGDGEDHLESVSAPVVMTAETALRYTRVYDAVRGAFEGDERSLPGETMPAPAGASEVAPPFHPGSRHFILDRASDRRVVLGESGDELLAELARDPGDGLLALPSTREGDADFGAEDSELRGRDDAKGFVTRGALHGRAAESKMRSRAQISGGPQSLGRDRTAA